MLSRLEHTRSTLAPVDEQREVALLDSHGRSLATALLSLLKPTATIVVQSRPVETLVSSTTAGITTVTSHTMRDAAYALWSPLIRLGQYWKPETLF